MMEPLQFVSSDTLLRLEPHGLNHVRLVIPNLSETLVLDLDQVWKLQKWMMTWALDQLRRSIEESPEQFFQGLEAIQ
jgi:hypothetical protein